MLAEHGDLPADTPWEWTGHRPGRHFLFSLSKSKEAGLLSGKGRTRLTYKDKKVGLDTRGEGGMIFVGRSRYMGLDRTVRQYEWVQEIAPDRSNLRALPGWLIENINASDAPTPAHAGQMRVLFHQVQLLIFSAISSGALIDGESPVRASGFWTHLFKMNVLDDVSDPLVL